ncbi:MAG: hypothetical protein K1X28_08860 [Parachlamydiales bacterium]|nr:hypothetical protein [Parachlamydiales bacterium]
MSSCDYVILRDQSPSPPPVVNQAPKGKLKGREVELVKKGDWDKSTKKVGTAGHRALEYGKIFFAGFFKLLKFILFGEFITEPVSAFLDSLHSDRKTLCDGYTEAVSKRFKGLEITVVQVPENEFGNAVRQFSAELPALKNDPEKLRARIDQLYPTSKEYPEVRRFLRECKGMLKLKNVVSEEFQKLVFTEEPTTEFERKVKEFSDNLSHLRQKPDELKKEITELLRDPRCPRNSPAAHFLHKCRSMLESMEKLSRQFDELELTVVPNTQFGEAVKKFSEELPLLKKDPEKLRARIVELSNHPGYDSKAKDPATLFLQECGHRLESADMGNTLWMYGRRKIDESLRDDSDRIGYSTFAKGLEKGQKSFGRSRDGFTKTFLWGMDNLDRLPHVVEAELDPLEYDSYKNQMVFEKGVLKDGEHEIIHKYTPGLTGPQSIVEKVLIPRYRSEGRRWVHIDNQSIHKADERLRIDEVHRISDENRDVFIQAVLSTDTLDEVNADLIKEFEPSKFNEFANYYVDALRGGNDAYVREYDQCRGIHIPRELLTDDELSAAFKTAIDMSKEAAKAKPGATKEQLVNMLRRNILSTLSWAIMKKEQCRQRGPNQPPSIISMNCKENIDRGPQENDDMLFSEDMCHGRRDISKGEAAIRAGINLGRADHAMRRPPQMKRMRPMLDRWEFLQDDELFRKGQASLTALREKLIKPQIDPRAERMFRDDSYLERKQNEDND